MKINKIWSGLLLSAVSLSVFAGDPGEGNDTTATVVKKPTNEYKTESGIKTSYMLAKADTGLGVTLKNPFNFLNKGKKKGKGLFESDLKLSGVVRALSIYRQMGDQYDDMIGRGKNISFSDYPITNAASSPIAGYPSLELNLQSHVTKYFNFNVGYSFSHGFSGNQDNGGSRKLTAVQNLSFTGNLKINKVKTSVAFGDILWSNLSKFTYGQPQYRDNYFDRLPWDWYRESFTRYKEYYALSSNIGAQGVGNSPLQGVIGFINWLPAQTSLKVIYGSSNRTATIPAGLSGLAAYNVGYRLEKVLFERGVRGKIGANLYMKRSQQALTGDRRDNNTIGSLDFDLKIRKVRLSGEFGMGDVVVDSITPHEQKLFENANGKVRGFGTVLKAEFDRRAVLWPFSVEFYSIDKNVVSIDGSILNSNPLVKNGGYNMDFEFNDVGFYNISNEVGQLANNRTGINLQFEANFGKVKAQVGYSTSQENDIISDTITMQHRVNSFSRSRFKPWFMAGGNYGRIKSAWFRTFETITLTNRDGNNVEKATYDREKLGFNTLELFLKTNFKVGKYEMVLLNFTSWNTVAYGFNAFGSSNSLTSLFYNDFTAAFKLNKKLSLVGNFAFESFKGSIYTDLSNDIERIDEKLEDRIINQLGTSSAIGIDYDFNRTTSLHWRTKYMTHEDKNFLRDKFNGYESTVELKIFF